MSRSSSKLIWSSWRLSSRLNSSVMSASCTSLASRVSSSLELLRFFECLVRVFFVGSGSMVRVLWVSGGGMVRVLWVSGSGMVRVFFVGSGSMVRVKGGFIGDN